MHSENQRNSQFMITKQVFIQHIPVQIEQHYELNPNCLGQGGFGRVFQGKKKKKLNQIEHSNNLGTSFSSFETSSRQGSDETNHSQLRAIKCMNFNKKGDKQLMKNQIQILSYLDHPSILKLYQTYQYKKQLYLVTDLLKGKDLYTYIDQRKETNQQQVKTIFLQLIKALNYLHSQHICHRDVKLQNVLFLDNHSLNIKLIDFGLAYCWDENMKRQLKQNGLNFKVVGTYDYMSPEMLAHNYDQRCDIWSAGVILYMLLSGTPPFQGKDDKEISKKIKNIDYTFEIPQFANISSSAKDLISKIFTPQHQRIQIQEIINHPWFNEPTFTCVKCYEQTSDTSVSSSSKNLTNNKTDKLIKNIKSIKSFDRIKKKSSLNSYQNSQCQLSCRSCFEEQDINLEQRYEQLTVQKMQYYSTFSKLRKLFAVYSVSQLSQSKIKSYGRQFTHIDKNHDGVISLQDLTEYLFQMQRFCDKQKTEFLFHELALSKRGYISYTQYLACTLSYESTFRNRFQSTQLQFDYQIPFQKTNLLSENTFNLEPIDIYNQHDIYDLFYILDKDRDGFISKRDFLTLLKNSGIDEVNEEFIEEIGGKILNLSSKRLVEQEEDEEWEYDPRKFKEFLSRTYKGESDGGPFVDFLSFKHLMISQRCQKDICII